MVHLQLDPFLNELTSMFEKKTEKGTVWVNLKRSCMKSKVQRSKMITAGEPLEFIIQATDGKKKIATTVGAKDHIKFQASYATILKEHMTSLKKRERKYKRKTAVSNMKEKLIQIYQLSHEELEKLAARYEKNIYNAATSQAEYDRMISMKMSSLETKYQNVNEEEVYFQRIFGDVETKHITDPGNMNIVVPKEQLPCPISSYNYNQRMKQQQLKVQQQQANAPVSTTPPAQNLPLAWDNAAAMKTQLDQQKTVVDSLVSNTRLLESKIQEAKSKKDTLKARAQSAKNQSKLSEMLGNVNTSTALGAFEKMEEEVLAMESQAEALGQLTTDDLEGKFALLETSSVDDDLASLKKELSGSSKKGELPSGRSPAASSNTGFPFRDTEIERELNELRQKAQDFK